MERNYRLLFRAINDIDLYIYQRKISQPDDFENVDIFNLYNDWIYSRGFSIGNAPDILYLIMHIEHYCKLSPGLMKAGLVRSGLIPAN